jgi:hypothetical protein
MFRASLAPKNRRTNRSPKLQRGIFLCRSLPAKSDFSYLSRGVALPDFESKGDARPRGLRPQWAGELDGTPKPVAASLRRPASRPITVQSGFLQPTNRTAGQKCCVLRETRAESYGSLTGSDRRSNAAMGRISWATALASDGGAIPSHERAAVSRRE